MTILAQILNIDIFDWLIYLGLAVLLFVQIWLVLKLKSISKQRKNIKLALNFLLWLVVLLFVIQPEWRSSANTSKVLILSENIPQKTIQKVKDSLKVTEIFLYKDFQQKVNDDQDFIQHLGNIYLLGQDFDAEFLSKLSEKNLQYLTYFKQNELQNIAWKGIVRKGDLQEIIGKIDLSEAKMLKIKFANQVLYSVNLQKGLNNFKFRFPTFSVGRTETELFLGDELFQKVAFFSRKNPPISVQFILENPDFESKTLAEWLGKNGNHVELTTTVAKNTQSQVSINKQKIFKADIVITDPSNAVNVLVKRAFADGKSILFLGLTNPELELKIINQSLGSQLFTKKISNEESIKISENLTALPYHFVEKLNQRVLSDYPVAIQRNFGKIGVSLLNETFPLKLSGDSVTYNKIWSSVFQQLNPDFEDNIEVDAPVFGDTKTNFSLNNRSISSNNLTISADTIQVENSAINPLSSETDFVFRKTGWQSLQDSLAVFVEENTSNLAKTKQIEVFMSLHSKYKTTKKANSTAKTTSKLPDWLWFSLLLICLTAVWIEPKLRF